MKKEDRIAYAKTRLEHAEQCLQTARANEINNDYRAAANRSYYAIFHAMRAALAMIDIEEQSRHAGVISVFRRAYIKTGLFPEHLSDIITSAFEIRNECDYDDFFIISKAEICDQIRHAEEFVGYIKAYLQSEGVGS